MWTVAAVIFPAGEAYAAVKMVELEVEVELGVEF